MTRKTPESVPFSKLPSHQWTFEPQRIWCIVGMYTYMVSLVIITPFNQKQRESYTGTDLMRTARSEMTRGGYLNWHHLSKFGHHQRRTFDQHAFGSHTRRGISRGIGFRTGTLRAN
ncbi:hypothetical protein AVEN_144670-1 [Araneus ventricosus]|uniref:Uncharacterized protein n=1 Tax=Araneus ventricosus TaxID=182803 RepID=A0A4Y2AZN9_ARAVE|nr:hypothetical protein AVEN_144670-1 [Araneus ventricosus]